MPFHLVRTSFDDVNGVLDIVLADNGPSCLVRMQTSVPSTFPSKPNRSEIMAFARRTLITLLDEWRTEGAQSDEAELKSVPSDGVDDEIERLIRADLSF